MINTSHDTQLAGLTTFGVPARCRTLARYTSARSDLAALHAAGLWSGAGRVKHIGQGANLLFTADFDGTLLLSADTTRAFTPGAHGTVVLEAASGCVLDSLAAEAAAMGLWGLENLSGIPGMTGGVTVQNVGAYGAELADVMESVDVFSTRTGRFHTLAAGECRFGYRQSRFKADPELLIAAMRLRLHTQPRPRLDYGGLRAALADADPAALTPGRVRQAVLQMRASKLPDPAETGSAGSFFKNPVIAPEAYGSLCQAHGDVPGFRLPDGRVKVPAAWLIDRAGWKGARQGGAAVWARQPLVIVNADGSATASDILELQRRIRADIASRYGIELVPEVEFVD